MKPVRGGLVVLCLASLMAGCGIGAGHVRVEDRPNDLVVGGKANKLVSLARPDRARDPADLVGRFLAAAADDEESRLATLRSYLTEQERSWKPGEKINVVRILDGPNAGPRDADLGYPVTVTIQRIGELTEGRIAPAEWDKEVLEFEVVQDGSAGLFLDRPEGTELFLPEESLRSRYDARPLYFRTTDGRLVTDLRYVPRYLSEEEKADRLVNWLYDGPAPWLGQAVVKLPPATRPTSKVFADKGGKLVVSLAAPPPENERELIAQQLHQTLVDSSATDLEINIQGQPLTYSAPVPASRHTPGRYAVVDGEVVRLRVPPRGDAPLHVLAEVNKNVVAVAFSRGEEAVALVRQQGGGSTLWVGPVGQPVQVSLPGNPRQLSQPEWLDQSSKLLLVLGDGKLYLVPVGRPAIQIQGVSNLEAMSVAPDGHRLALVVEGKLKIAALTRPAEGQISVGITQSVPTAFAQVQNVAFGANHGLVVAGKDTLGTRIVVMNVDGALQSPKGEALSGSLRVSRLVADPQTGAILYELKGINSYELLETRSDELWHSVVRSGSPAEVKVSAPSFEG